VTMAARALSAIGLSMAVVTALAQTVEPTDPQVAWVKANAFALRTVEAGNGFEDLQQLKGAIGDARIVSLGEATHGTREIFQLKHRLTEFLATELGFTIFSIEANMPEAHRVNEYVLHGRGDPKALLQGMYFWTWNTEEVLEMIEWMRRFNASGKGRIQFTGFDMQTARVAIETVSDLLRKVDPDYAVKVRRIYQAADTLRPAQTGFGVATGSFPVSAAAGKTIRFSGAIRTVNLDGFAGLWWRADGPDGVLAFDNMQARAPKGTTDWKRYEIVLEVPRETVNINFGVLMPGKGTAWFDDLRLEIDGKPYDATSLFDFGFESGQIKGFFTPASGYTARVDDSTAADGTRSLRLQSSSDGGGSPAPRVSPAEASRSFAGVVEHMERARDEYAKRAEVAAVDWAIQNAGVVHQYAQMMAGQVSRDESMARNVKWVLDTAPEGTRVVLWAHNGHVGRIEQGAYRAMGAYLDDWYGNDHVVMGFTLNRGEYTAIKQGTGLGPHPLAPPAPGSYEHVFARAGLPRFIADLRTAKAGDPSSGWLRAPMSLRSIGAVAAEQQFHPATLAEMFDLVVFLDETTPTRGLWNPR
jgi:erythromycin esterase-like protein